MLLAGLTSTVEPGYIEPWYIELSSMSNGCNIPLEMWWWSIVLYYAYTDNVHCHMSNAAASVLLLMVLLSLLLWMKIFVLTKVHCFGRCCYTRHLVRFWRERHVMREKWGRCVSQSIGDLCSEGLLNYMMDLRLWALLQGSCVELWGLLIVERTNCLAVKCATWDLNLLQIDWITEILSNHAILFTFYIWIWLYAQVGSSVPATEFFGCHQL